MITINAPTAESTFISDSSTDKPWFLTVGCAITATALGTMRLTLRWTDPYAGAQTRTFDSLLTGAQFTHEDMLPLVQANGSDVTYQVTHLSVIGSPAYTICLDQHT